jgi:hypothetical protein
MVTNVRTLVTLVRIERVLPPVVKPNVVWIRSTEEVSRFQWDLRDFDEA